MKNLIYLLIFTVLSVLSFSCKKPLNYSNKNLSFSTDSLLFDTVFTTIGSTTKRFKIYNTDNTVINIEEMELMGGANSPFRINIDGTSGLIFNDVDLDEGDSLFAFVEVTLAVNNLSNPLVISDSIRFKTNGKNQYVNLDVWGQDAYFHVNELVSDAIEPWLNDKPHVIYGLAAVGYPETETSLEVVNQTLTIPGGTQVYGHKGAKLFVYKSTLIVNGTLGDEVTFEGDRLESFYNDVSGQWRGIHLNQAKDCIIDYAVIKNGGIGLQVDTTSSNTTLTLKNTIITNNDFYNLYLVAGPIVTVENCVFGDAGVISAFSFAGGDISFTNCNFVNYFSGSRSGPSFGVKTWYEVNSTIYERPLKLKVYNSVVYGNVLNELVIDSLANSSYVFDVTFENCLYKSESELNYTYIINSIWNQDPLFVDSGLKDFKLKVNSPLIDAGSSTNFTTQSIDGVGRSNPDIGAYEY
jgi:hypothetical protein